MDSKFFKRGQIYKDFQHSRSSVSILIDPAKPEVSTKEVIVQFSNVEYKWKVKSSKRSVKIDLNGYIADVIDVVVTITIDKSVDLAKSNARFLCLEHSFGENASSYKWYKPVESIKDNAVQVMIDGYGLKSGKFNCEVSFAGRFNIAPNYTLIDNFIGSEEVQSGYRRRFYGYQRIADFTFICGDRSFKINKSVLSADNEYFKNLFNSGLIETQRNEAVVTDIDPEVFEFLLNFVQGKSVDYSALCDQDSSLVLHLYIAADKYGVEKLKEICLAHIFKFYLNKMNEDGTINVGNLHETWRFADAFQLNALKQYCEECFT